MSNVIVVLGGFVCDYFGCHITTFNALQDPRVNNLTFLIQPEIIPYELYR